MAKQIKYSEPAAYFPKEILAKFNKAKPAKKTAPKKKSK